MSAPKRYTEEVKAEAVRRYMAGESSPKIAADLGCSAHAMLSWVNKSFETPEMPETPKRSEDTMIEEKVEKKEMTVKETPAAAATATDVGKKSIETASKSRYLYDNTEAGFCQAIIAEIDESAEHIRDNAFDQDTAAYYAGKIQGLVYALTLIRGIKNDY